MVTDSIWCFVAPNYDDSVLFCSCCTKAQITLFTLISWSWELRVLWSHWRGENQTEKLRELLVLFGCLTNVWLQENCCNFVRFFGSIITNLPNQTFKEWMENQIPIQKCVSYLKSLIFWPRHNIIHPTAHDFLTLLLAKDKYEIRFVPTDRVSHFKLNLPDPDILISLEGADPRNNMRWELWRIHNSHFTCFFTSPTILSSCQPCQCWSSLAVCNLFPIHFTVIRNMFIVESSY